MRCKRTKINKNRVRPALCVDLTDHVYIHLCLLAFKNLKFDERLIHMMLTSDQADNSLSPQPAICCFSFSRWLISSLEELVGTIVATGFSFILTLVLSGVA